MKKLLYLAVAAMAALSSCSNDDVINDNENENQNYKVEAPVFTATIEGEAQTRTQLVEGSTTGKLTKVNWESGDEVKMVFVNSGYSVISLPVYMVTPSTVDASTATLTIKEGETYNEAADLLFFAIYPASLMTDQMKYIFPATQEYKGDGKIGFAPMLGVNESQSVPQTLNFKNACALLEITIPYTEMTSVRSITVSSDLQMNGQMNLDTGVFFYFDSPSNPGSGENLVTLDCYSLNNANVAIPEGGSKTFYVSIVPREKVTTVPYLKYLQIDVTDGNITKTMRTKTFEGTQASGIDIKSNTIYPIAFEKNYDPNLLAGEFSVSATKKVKFTKANLWWDGSAYQFEADQTNYPTAWNTSHVGHFFWSNYTDYTRTDEHAHDYKPYFSSFGASSKATTDVFWCGETHPLEVAGTQGLYTLSADEWNYLLNIPNNNNPVGRTQNNRFAKARVNGKVGLLIFPDDYNGTTKLTGITGMCTINEDWDDAYPGESESIDPATWTDMESAGVVFLPAAGYRGTPNGETIRNENYCYYWSSTPNSDYTDRANGLYGNGNQFTCPGTILRNYGSSIRLVKTVE